MKVRKIYRKPEITRVKLVPEEAVLGGCKRALGGPVGANNTAGCITPNSCVAVGT